MSTIFILQPEAEERQSALNTLLDGLEHLWPGEIETRQALAVTTEIPEVIQLLTSLVSPRQATLPEAGASAISPAKKARRQPRPKQSGSNGSSGPQPVNVDLQIAELEAEPSPASDQPAEAAGEKNASSVRQSFPWQILATGKQFSDPYYLLKKRKLSVGDRLRHRERGLFEVVEKQNGQGLTLHKLAS